MATQPMVTLSLWPLKIGVFNETLLRPGNFRFVDGLNGQCPTLQALERLLRSEIIPTAKFAWAPVWKVQKLVIWRT
jgi:hypothetical protein